MTEMVLQLAGATTDSAQGSSIYISIAVAVAGAAAPLILGQILAVASRSARLHRTILEDYEVLATTEPDTVVHAALANSIRRRAAELAAIRLTPHSWTSWIPGMYFLFLGFAIMVWALLPSHGKSQNTLFGIAFLAGLVMFYGGGAWVAVIATRERGRRRRKVEAILRNYASGAELLDQSKWQSRLAVRRFQGITEGPVSRYLDRRKAERTASRRRRARKISGG